MGIANLVMHGYGKHVVGELERSQVKQHKSNLLQDYLTRRYHLHCQVVPQVIMPCKTIMVHKA